MKTTQDLVTRHLDIWTAADTEKKTGRGRASGNAGSVYGIKKLRELILELAVRGKLVPQDANDESTSVLIKRIQAEKAKLIAEGKIKKDKPLAVITEEEKSFELPKSWEWVRLGDISSTVQYGYTDSANHHSRDVLFLRITDIQDDAVNWATVPGCSISLSDSDSYALENNDLVIARTGGTIGKSYLVTGLDQKAVFASYLIRIGNLSSTSAEYKKVFLGSVLYWRQLIASSMGTGQPNVNGTALKNLIFSLPPLAEQRRIVAKVDELMALCDQLETQHNNATEAHDKLVSHLLGTLTQSKKTDTPLSKRGAGGDLDWQRIAAHFDTLFTTESSIDALKQTLLQLAVMGKLVPQDPNDEPASTLLKKIAAEKVRLVDEDGLRTTAAEAEHKYFDWLPPHWECERLGNLAKFIDYRGRTPTKVNEGIPLITAKNVRYGYIDREPREFVTPSEYKQWMTRGFPRVDDLLFTTEAPLGNAALVDIDEKFALAQRVICFQFHKPEISKFMLLAFMSLNMQQEFQQEATGMTATGIKASKLKEIPVPLPPIEEQHRIVTKVDELMALCDQLKTRITQANQLQQKLADVMVEQII